MSYVVCKQPYLHRSVAFRFLLYRATIYLKSRLVVAVSDSLLLVVNPLPSSIASSVPVTSGSPTATPLSYPTVGFIQYTPLTETDDCIRIMVLPRQHVAAINALSNAELITTVEISGRGE